MIPVAAFGRNQTVILSISYYIRRDRESQKLLLERAQRKCLHLYHYWIDPVFGFMSERLQSWFPFSIQLFLNGREWLSRCFGSWKEMLKVPVPKDR